MIKVLAIDFATWMVDGSKNQHALGDFDHFDDVLSAIWMHIVQTRKHHAYLLFRRPILLPGWQLERTMFWGTLQGDVPKIHQEILDSSAAKRAAKLYKV